MLGFGTGQLWEPPLVEAELDHDREDLGPTDTQRLVASIGLAARVAELPSPRVPWLPELCPV